MLLNASVHLKELKAAFKSDHTDPDYSFALSTPVWILKTARAVSCLQDKTW